jgi:hypothetical protein
MVDRVAGQTVKSQKEENAMAALFMEITDVNTGKPKIVGLPHVALIQPSEGAASDGAVIFLTGDHVPARQIVTKETFADIRRALGVAS